ECLETGNHVWHQAQGAGQRSSLIEDIRANAGQVSEREAEVDLASKGQLFPAPAGQHARKGLGVGWREPVLAHRHQLAIDACRWRPPGGKEEVGTPSLRNGVQQGPDVVAGGLIHGGLVYSRARWAPCRSSSSHPTSGGCGFSRSPSSSVASCPLRADRSRRRAISAPATSELGLSSWTWVPT